MDGQEQNPQNDFTAPVEATPFAPDTSVPIANAPEAPVSEPTFAPAPIISTPPAVQHVSEDIVLDGGAEVQNAKQKKLIVIGGIVLGVIVVLGIIWLIVSLVLRPKKQALELDTTIGKMNTAVIFDETAPIPFAIDDKYGYIKPEDGAQLIGTQFFEADRFYGDYAKVKRGTADNIIETSIINRSGETVFTFSGDNTATYYDLENNFWLIDGDLYNIKMQKINPDNTTGKYIGNGYILIINKTIDQPSENSPVEDKNAQESQTGQSKQAEQSEQTEQTEQKTAGEAGYIANVDGNKAYACAQYCSAFTVAADGTTYAVVRAWGAQTQIINLSASETIYTTPNDISMQDNTLAEQTGEGIKYFKISNGKVLNIAAPEAVVATISNAGEYVIESCKNSKYTIKTVGGGTVVNCDIDDYYEVPTSLYEAYRNQFAEAPILIMIGDDLRLFDMINDQVIKSYGLQSAKLFEDSPFLQIQNSGNSEMQVCNLLSKNRKEDTSCMKLGGDITAVEGSGNYFIANDDQTKKIYNAALKEIKQ